jgi:cytosine/creatinine deaminase
LDLVFRDVLLEGRDTRLDIGVQALKIAAIGNNLPAPADPANDIAASGMMASPLFIDPHHHLDCAYLDEYINHSGTLEEAIEINARIKDDRPAEEIYAKACRALTEALANGTGWIRNHVDVDSVSGLKLLHPIVEAKEKFAGVVDVQIVCFPQLGLVRDPESVPWMRESMRQGADVVGGMPHAEVNMQDAQKHIDIAFEIAKQFDADVDMHIDETDDPNSRTLELLAETTLREGYQGRVIAGHCCALAAYPDEYAQRVMDKVAEAEITVVTNPMINLYLQGRGDSQPVRRGITRVKELLQAGANISCGLDDVKNIFFPFGRMDMLEVALVTALTAHLSTPAEIQTAFDMPRQRAAQALRLADYEIQAGAPANFTLFAATNAQDALRLQPPRRYVVRGGRILAENVVEQKLYLA